MLTVQAESQSADLVEQNHIGAAIKNPVGSGVAKFSFLNSRAKSDDPRPCHLASANARGDVFEDDALRSWEAQFGGGFEKRFRVGFAPGYVGGSHKAFWNRQTRRPQANFRERTSAGCGNRPALGGKTREQLPGAGKKNNSVHICHFASFHLAILRLVVGLGKVLPDGGKTGAAVGMCHDSGGIKPALLGPSGPHAADGRRRVDQHAVKVEEQGAGGDFDH